MYKVSLLASLLHTATRITKFVVPDHILRAIQWNNRVSIGISYPPIWCRQVAKIKRLWFYLCRCGSFVWLVPCNLKTITAMARRLQKRLRLLTVCLALLFFCLLLLYYHYHFSSSFPPLGYTELSRVYFISSLYLPDVIHLSFSSPNSIGPIYSLNILSNASPSITPVSIISISSVIYKNNPKPKPRL